MWSALTVIVGVMVLSELIRESKKQPCFLLSYLASILLLRFFLSAFHEITFVPLIMGLSINAIFSILTVLISLFIMPRYLWSLKLLLPIYAFIGSLLVSSLLNDEVIAGISTLFKWLYLCVVTLLTYHTIKLHGITTTLKTLLIPYLFPVILLVLSILLSNAKQTELDGSISYIGGYNHEAVFSVMIFTFLMLISLRDKASIRYQPIIFFFALTCLYLINYRTALLASVPIVLLFYWDYSVRLIHPSMQLVVRLLIALLIILLIAVSLPLLSERFIDIPTAIMDMGNLISSDIYYTRDQQRLFSGRIYFWSQYLTTYSEAPLKQLLFGFGPDSWKQYFSLYAHNTYVSYIFEFGIIGLSAFLFVLFLPLSQLILQPNSALRTKLLAAFVGFLILNMATMPIWQIEGLMLLGILLGVITAQVNENLNSKNTSMSLNKIYD